MGIINKFIISIVLFSGGVTIAYSQDCNTYLQRATEMVSKKNYCDAKKYYQMYGGCNADVDVSTEIAMCERFLKVDREDCDDWVPDPSARKSGSRNPNPYNPETVKSSPVKPLLSTQGFSGFHLHAGLFLPQGNFAENAATGYNLGAKVYSPIASVKGLSWFIGADVYYNAMQTEALEQLIEDNEENGYDVTSPKILNIPVLGGVNYTYSLNETIGLYGELGLGLNVSKFTDLKISDEESSETYKYDIVTGFAYGLEAGILLKGKYTIGVRYNNLGSYKLKGKYVYEYDGDIMTDEKFTDNKISISGIALTVGILF
jgi:hypothetical protein